MADSSDLNQQTYDWCVRAFGRVKNMLGVRIKLHHEQGQIEQGDIFLFNHFARAETFIPQYLIYRETGAFCRSVAAAEFFKGNGRFTQVLRDLGAVPSNHPDLMALLARDILRGRKIVIFPEGGMVKDRQVLDDEGQYSVFSRSAQSRRKHHTGAARLAIGLQIVKLRVLEEHQRNNHRLLEEWAERLELPSVESLIQNAKRPVSLVPANITFYPLRISDNILRKGADMLHGSLSQRAIEELIVEGNLFFKTTDMDIRLGDAICPLETWAWWERWSAIYLSRQLDNPRDIFDGQYLRAKFVRKTATKGLKASISRLRNRYMRDIYGEVTINTSHLASVALLKYAESGSKTVSLSDLKRVLYLAIKYLQRQPEVHLHRSICNPSVYLELLKSHTPELIQFLQSAVDAKLIELGDTDITLLEKLTIDHEFDSVRLENPIEVYANEIEPVVEVDRAIDSAMADSTKLTPAERARHSFDDELVAHEWDRILFNKREHHDINQRETATADPRPFLLEPENSSGQGVLLIHGFLSSPAEVRSMGDRLAELGYIVLGVRLKGHGTSPWDLRERNWQDWYASVDRGLDTLRGLSPNVSVLGFSTGGALALLLGARRPTELISVVSVCAPIKFRNKNLRFVPLMHGANKVMRWLSKYEGVMPFRPNESEHPHINYRNIPIRGLYELTRMVTQLKSELAQVSCPVCIVQSTGDKVVDPTSATIAFDLVSTKDKELHMIESIRHGILNENIGGTQELLIDYLRRTGDSLKCQVKNLN
ncbi:MAG: alpha/beta fold hydrolase [Proteobacteria bacterium]|nr:alpha/beta fold hydrolase [Pseudomonadota bacterium]